MSINIPPSEIIDEGLDNGNSLSGSFVTISGSNNARLIIVVHTHDYSNVGIGSTSISFGGLSFLLATSVINPNPVSGGDLKTEVWFSDPFNYVISDNITVTVLPGPYRIQYMRMLVENLNSDNALVINNSAVTIANNTTSISISSGSSLGEALAVVGFAESRAPNDFSSPGDGFTYDPIESVEYTTPGSQDDNLGGMMAYKVIGNEGVNPFVNVVDPTHLTANVVIFAGAIEREQLHFTNTYKVFEQEIDHASDSLLNGVFTKQHTTDSILKGVGTLLHSSDASLKGTIDKQHNTDIFIRPPEREPILRSLLINNIPVGPNVGSFPIRILGMHGNNLLSNQFTYVLPPQEFIVGKSASLQLSIIDNIIKKDFESTIIEETPEPAEASPLNNLEFKGFPVLFDPSLFPYEEFIAGW